MEKYGRVDPLDADLRKVYVRLAGKFREAETARAKSLQSEEVPIMM